MNFTCNGIFNENIRCKVLKFTSITVIIVKFICFFSLSRENLAYCRGNELLAPIFFIIITEVDRNGDNIYIYGLNGIFHREGFFKEKRLMFNVHPVNV